MTRPIDARATLAVASLLLGACGGGGSGSDPEGAPAADPSAPAADGAPLVPAPSPGPDAAAPAPVVNGFVEVRRTDRDASGELLFEETRTVDTDGNRLLARFDEGADGTEDAVATFDYDAAGNLVRATFDGENVAFVETHEHDADGRLLESRYVESTGRRAAELTAFEYDEAGRLLTRSVFDVDAEGPLLRRASYAYGPDGLAESGLELGFDRDDLVGPDGDGEPTSIRREVYEHDAAGRPTVLRYDEDDDGLIDGEVGYAYDGDGNMVRLERTDAAGELVRVEEYEYAAAEEPIYNRWLRAFRFFL